MAAEILFVTGTDTEVGKTVVSTALALESVAAGLDVTYFKPVQTGVRRGGPGDTDFVRAVAGVEAVEGQRLTPALAPAVAAAVEGEKVDADALHGRALDLARDCDRLIVEGAGGLLVLLSDRVDMAEFARMLDAELIVATRPTLGTLNHTALTVEVARQRGLDPALVISNWPEEPGLTETTNLEQLRDMAPLMGVVPTITGLDVESGDSAVAPTLIPPP